jgi:hypothetical protein
MAPPNRSRWRILAVPLGFAFAIAIFLFAGSIARKTMAATAPNHAFFCTPTHGASIVLFLALAVLSIPLGFLAANILFWLLPPVRAAFGVATFTAANTQLLKFGGLAALILLPVVWAALSSRVCLSDSVIDYQTGPFSPLEEHPLSEIASLQPACERGSRGGWNFALAVVLRDGTKLDLAAVSPWYSQSAPAILAALGHLPSDNARIDPACPAGFRKLIVVGDARP